jgi:hypothetical protein
MRPLVKPQRESLLDIPSRAFENKYLQLEFNKSLVLTFGNFSNKF